MKSVLITLFITITTALQAQSVKLPTKVEGDAGSWIVIVPESKDGGEVKWKIGKGLTLVPIDKLFPGQKPAGVVVQGQKGTYEVWAWNAKGDIASDLAVTVITIGGGEPPPPPPPPPVPDDPLLKSVKNALERETAGDKVLKMQQLGSVYRVAAGEIEKSNKTLVFDFFKIMQESRKTLIGDSLPIVRAELTTYMDAILPKSVDAPLDDAVKKLCALHFTKIANAISACCP